MVSQTDWVERLNSESTNRDEAITQLRAILIRGLQKALSSKGVDNAFVEDITQDALLRILDSLETFEGRSRFTTWAMAIAIRTAVSEMRRRHFKDVSLEQVINHDDGQVVELEDSDTVTVSATLDKEILYANLRRLIESDLTQHQQTVIRALLGGMPVETIADRLGTNRNAVYKTMHDARIKLKRAFESSGVSREDIQGILAGGA
ncbi:RNA polymerase sigma factor [Thalassoglobus sp.]|uniref:RNA polymerase sigma factor n=1 Tax=Thalassoglobus sp. TaxID=2795869 RepID=UPI003AA7FD1F